MNTPVRLKNLGVLSIGIKYVVLPDITLLYFSYLGVRHVTPRDGNVVPWPLSDVSDSRFRVPLSPLQYHNYDYFLENYDQLQFVPSQKLTVWH